MSIRTLPDCYGVPKEAVLCKVGEEALEVVLESNRPIELR